MEKTGESYTSARAQLLPRDQEPDVGPTGRPYREWFAELDAWGATEAPHKEIAAWLRTERGVAGWWAQNITVEYERARGLRAVGQGRDGLFSVGATKTIAVPVEELYAAVTDPRRREEWLPGVHLNERTATPYRTARYDWGEGSTRVVAGFDAKGEGKCQLSIQHEKLPDGESAATDEGVLARAAVRPQGPARGSLRIIAAAGGSCQEMEAAVDFAVHAVTAQTRFGTSKARRPAAPFPATHPRSVYDPRINRCRKHARALAAASSP